MKRKPLSDADREAAKNLRRIWDEKKSTLGLTQEKAAERLRFGTQGAVSHYLNGYTPLNTDAVLKFAQLLNVAPTDIRPDIQDKLGTSMPCKDGLSKVVCETLAWFAEQATRGILTDTDFLLLRGRAEQMTDNHSSGYHDWIVGGAPERRKRNRDA